MATTIDVNVLIKARDEASKALHSFGQAAESVGSKVGRLRKGLDFAGAGLKQIGVVGAVWVAALGAFAVKAAFSAARTEELGFALSAIAKANNISKDAID